MIFPLSRWLVLVGLIWPGDGKVLAAKPGVVATRFAVTSGHPDATALGMEVLRGGGNVMDAAVATSLMLGMAEPYGSGIGGKGMLLYRDGRTGRVYAIEAMSMASKSLDAATFSDRPRHERYYGYTSVAVPGLVAALDAAHQRWGRIDWRDLMSIVADRAEQGVMVSEGMYQLMRPKRNLLRRDAEAAGIYLADGETPTVGSRMKNRDLVRTIRLIGAHGAKALYGGEIAKQIVEAANQAGAPLTIDDFRDYQVRWSEPLAVEFGNYRVYSSPPPLTGGTTVLAALRALDGVAALDATDGREPKYIDLVGRVMLALYPRISRQIADMPNALNDARNLCGDDLVRTIQAEATAADPAEFDADPAKTGAFEATADDQADASTTHLIVADSEGNIACLTQSLSFHFGSCVVAPGTGILLNDSLSNFSTSNRAAANYIGPGKRERSTIAPIVATCDGEAALALGIPGGQRIPTTTIQLVIDILHFGIDPEQAFARPRFHVRRPIGKEETANMVDLEEDAPQEYDESLVEMGWKPIRHARDGHYFGGGSAILFRPDGMLEAVADPRRTNAADGE